MVVLGFLAADFGLPVLGATVPGGFVPGGFVPGLAGASLLLWNRYIPKARMPVSISTSHQGCHSPLGLSGSDASVVLGSGVESVVMNFPLLILISIDVDRLFTGPSILAPARSQISASVASRYPFSAKTMQALFRSLECVSRS